MNADNSGLIDAATERVIGVFYSVHTEMGFGFVETVYENAFAVALRAAGLDVEQQDVSLSGFAASTWESSLQAWSSSAASWSS